MKVKLTNVKTGKVKTFDPDTDRLIFSATSKDPIRILVWDEYSIEVMDGKVTREERMENVTL